MPDYVWEVALSFAGEQREYVAEVAKHLKEGGVPCFYDEDNLVALWGEDLAEIFDRIYRLDSEFAVIFISKEYVAKEWTRHERRSALARALSERSAYILPARFDDTDVPGLQPTVHFLPLADVSPAELAATIVEKVNLRRAERGLSPAEDRGPGWEYLLLTDELEVGYDSLRSLRLDVEAGFSRPSGVRLESGHAVAAAISQWSDDAVTWSGNIGRLLAGPTLEAALGAPGEPGDAERIVHLASALTRTYEGLLNWAQEVRGASAPEWARPTLEALSRYTEQPIESYGEYVDRWKHEVRPVLLAARSGSAPDEPLTLDMPLVFTIPDEIQDAFNTAFQAAQRQGHFEN